MNDDCLFCDKQSDGKHWFACLLMKNDWTRLEAKEAIPRLGKEIERLQKELAIAKESIQTMVNKAADNNLEGYREQGRQILGQTLRAEKSEKENKMLRDAFVHKNDALDFYENHVSKLNNLALDQGRILNKLKKDGGERARKALTQKMTSRDLPCTYNHGLSTCGYPENECMHEGSDKPAPPAGRHRYVSTSTEVSDEN